MKPLQSAYWAIGCWLILTLIAFGLDPLVGVGHQAGRQKQYVDHMIQDLGIQNFESAAALSRQQLIDMWLPLGSNYELVPASLTPVRDRSPMRRSAVLDRGIESGLHKGMGVVSEMGIVGRIVNSGSGWSRVQLADDPGFVTRFIDDNLSRGILSGSLVEGEARLKLRLDPMEFSENELLFTDGSGGVFPANVFVGSVVEPRTPVRDSRILLPGPLDVAREVLIFVPVNSTESK